MANTYQYKVRACNATQCGAVPVRKLERIRLPHHRILLGDVHLAL